MKSYETDQADLEQKLHALWQASPQGGAEKPRAAEGAPAATTDTAGHAAAQPTDAGQLNVVPPLETLNAPKPDEQPRIEADPPRRAAQEQPVQALDVRDLDITVPQLTERREGRSKADLMPELRPTFKQDGRMVSGLRSGDDYLLAYFRGGGVDEPTRSADRMRSIQDAGDYRMVVTGVSDKLTGQVAVPFAVRPRAKSRRPLAIALALLGVAAAIAAVVLFATGGPDAWFDTNAGEGLAGIHDDDLQAYLDAKVDEGKMNITVLSKLVFEGGTAVDPSQPGEIGFNNIPGNHVDQKLFLTMDDTGEVVYESGAIPPGYSIQYITLNRELAPGVYEATATVTGYNTETHAEEGSLAVKVQILVMG